MPVDGTYNIEIETPIGKQDAVLKLETAGDKLTGSIKASLGNADFTGTVNGDTVSWSVEISSPMGAMTLECSGAVSGNDISGSVKAGNIGTWQFKGKKI